MGRPGKSRLQRRARALAREQAEREFGNAPHSFVFPKGRVGRSLRGLCRDLRRVLEPFTARALQVRANNSLRDLVAVAGPLGVSHFLVLSKTPTSINLKLFRLPGGPTLTFKVLQYSLIRDVVSSLRRHRMHEQQFSHPPLLVLSNFGLPQIHVKLMAGMFQGMFPALNVHKVNLNSIRRCLLLTLDPDSQLLQFRHYSVQVVPVGVSRGLRKLLQEKFPNLSRLQDISDLFLGEVALSESEAEQDGSHNVLELPQDCAGRGNRGGQQSAVRLTEIGPRLTLQLVKVEEGLGQGSVLYHGLVHRSPEELQELQQRREQKLLLKAQRRQKQEQDLERKRRLRLLNRERSLAGMRRRQGQDGPGDKGDKGDSARPGDNEGDSDVEDPGAPEGGAATPSEDEEDDAEYYRQEVGEEPDTDLFPTKRKRSPSGSSRPWKRRRQSRETPKSHPNNPKSHKKPAKSHPNNPKPHKNNPKSHLGTQKSHRNTSKSHKNHPKSHPKTPKSPSGTPKSHPGPPRSHKPPPKSHKTPPKSQARPKVRGQLLGGWKTGIFQRPGKTRKGKK